MGIVNQFWFDILLCWSKINFVKPTDTKQILNQVVWYNTLIKIGGKIVYIPEMYDVGIIYLKDLWNQGALMSYAKFCEIFGRVVDIMKYNSLIDAIPPEWRKITFPVDEEPEWQCLYGELSQFNKWTKLAYGKLNYGTAIPRLVWIWSRLLGHRVDKLDIINACKAINISTTIVKYRSFQYRLLHNAILLNNRLMYMGICSDNMCDFCKNDRETYVHFFFNCPIVVSFWEKLFSELGIDIQQLNWNPMTLLLNCVHPEPPNYVNLITLVTKQQIFAAKCKKSKPQVVRCITEIEFIHELEHSEAIEKGKFQKYNLRWPDQLEGDNKCDFGNGDYVVQYIGNM